MTMTEIHRRHGVLVVRSTLDAQRAANERAYEAAAQRLKDCPGKWIAIVGGQVLDPVESFEKALEVADKASKYARHRLVLAVGKEEDPLEEKQWNPSSGGAVELGSALQGRLKIAITTGETETVFERAGHTVKVPVAAGESFAAYVGQPGDDFPIGARVHVNPTFAHDLAIPDATARHARLEAFAIPGP